MTVHDQGDTQKTVDDRVSGTAGNERGASDRKERGSKEPLESPMVRPVALVWWGKIRRIVHCSFINGYTTPDDRSARKK